MRGSAACWIAPKLVFALSFWKFVSDAESSMKFARLNTLKNSARNWSRQRSVIEKFLSSPMSHVNEPGKRKLPLPTLPKVLAAFDVKALGLSQSTQDVAVILSAAQAPEAYGLPTRLARSCPIPVPEPLIPDTTVKGRPVCAETRPPHCQPPKKCRTQPFAPDRCGSS